MDRYVAVTRPVKYRSIMTPPRAKTIVAAVWIVSFLICFPPLLQQWKPAATTITATSKSTSEVAAPSASALVITPSSGSFSTQTTATGGRTAATTSITNKPIALSDFDQTPGDSRWHLTGPIQQISTKISRKRRSIRRNHDGLSYASTTPARLPHKLDIALDNRMRGSAQGSRHKATLRTLRRPTVSKEEFLLHSLAFNGTGAQEQKRNHQHQHQPHLTRTPTLMTTGK